MNIRSEFIKIFYLFNSAFVIPSLNIEHIKWKLKFYDIYSF